MLDVPDPTKVLICRINGDSWTDIGRHFGCAPRSAQRAMRMICTDVASTGEALLRSFVYQSLVAEFEKFSSAFRERGITEWQTSSFQLQD